MRELKKRVMRKDMNKVERAILDHSGNACDYCTNQRMVKVTIYGHYWFLCYDCALEHADRFNLDVEEIHKIARENDISLSEGDGTFFVRSESEVYNTHENTEADARAKMLIWLIEEKLVEANK